jgi:hypothetical protein
MVIHDVHKYGWLSLGEIIKVSSNIGASKVAKKLGKGKLYQYLKGFGFGSKTGVDLPGEVPGEHDRIGGQKEDEAVVSGKILAEKAEQLVVDLGFTVLSIPRNQIETITRETSAASSPAPAPPPAKIQKDLYYVANTPPAELPVREWVQQLGEAVVQVRTPSGLGSGFILNEDGYLITTSM